MGYRFTEEVFNEDENRWEYRDYEVIEGETFFDRGMGERAIVTVSDEDHWIVCPYDSETGTDTDNEYMANDCEWSRSFKPVAIREFGNG